MEALDGFMLIVEEGGRIEFASENVSEFLGIPQVRDNFIFTGTGRLSLLKFDIVILFMNS